ncbi:glycosyltransferase [Clostridium sp. UBA1652]|uniref:glycosyltransferase n=1 Tax=Clostridium sp. UBA1652 TaxID=1946348 RepID=UPI00257EBAB4|nr:glycosyltransferase family 2 protein [Clostridium sp. UBA1652]
MKKGNYKIDLICPLYKSESYIENLHKSLLMQQGNFELNIKYIFTKTANDNTETILEKLEAQYSSIEEREFSHSLTREKEALKCSGDIIVFITQDIIIKDTFWLEKLTEPIINKECEACFSRQICSNNSIEKYIRIHNYPKESRIVSQEDTERLGIMTFFFSDASSAINTKIYKDLNGYDGRNLITNEDMYFAYKLIKSGYKIKYCADSEVIHSHDYKFMELFKRYVTQGRFLKQNSYLMKYGAQNSAFKLLKLVIIESLKESNFKAFFSIIPNFIARFLGDKFGQYYEKKVMKKKKHYLSTELFKG